MGVYLLLWGVILLWFRFDGNTGSFRVTKAGLIGSARCVSDDKSTREWELRLLLKEAKEAAAQDLEMLERSSDVVIGMRIIQQFVVDLLGRHTPIATIFRHKTEEE